MGLGDAFKGLFGIADDERQAAQEELQRAKYEALQNQADMEREANEAIRDLERETNEKLNEAAAEKAEVEKRAFEKELKLQRENNDIAQESLKALTRMQMENFAQNAEIQKEAASQVREVEKNARDAEIRLREKNEEKLEKERAEAKAREDQKQKEATAAINEANRCVLEMKDKTHSEITQLVMDNQKNKDELMKENLRAIEAKDAANAEKLDKLMSNYERQKKEAQELAQQREDALNLERKAVDDKYRKDMENKDKMSKEERDKMTNDYQKMIEEKDNELSKNQREKDAKMDELNKNHLADLRKAHDDYNDLMRSSKEEVERLLREKEGVLRESAAKLEESAKNMLELAERKNNQLLAMCENAAYCEAEKMMDHSEFLMIDRCREDLSPIKTIKSSLIDNITDTLELWQLLEDSDPTKTKGEIILKYVAIKKNISDLLKTIDGARSLGEKKEEWMNILRLLSDEASTHARSATRELRKEATTIERFQELEEECEDLKKSIFNLPDMSGESLASAINRTAQRAIAAKKESLNAITGGDKDGSKEALEAVSQGEPSIEEP